MYYLLKVLSYSPIFNVVGSDSDFGDLEKNSRHIRISLLGFTLIYHLTFFTFYFCKATKKINFNIFHAIKYPIANKEQSKINSKIEEFISTIEGEGNNCNQIRLDSIKHRLEGQEKNVNNSLMKAGYILPVFIGLFIYLIQSKLIIYSYYNFYITFAFYFLLFCFLAISLNILYFLARLTNVSTYIEIGLPKGKNENELLTSAVIEYYTKFKNNEIRSLNSVSYNKWVQDYFKKFFLYSSLLFGLIILSDNLGASNNKNTLVRPKQNVYTISYRDSTCSIIDPKTIYDIIDEINGYHKSIVFIVSKQDSLNLKRIQKLNNTLEYLSRYKISSVHAFAETNYMKTNTMYIIIERKNNE